MEEGWSVLMTMFIQPVDVGVVSLHSQSSINQYQSVSISGNGHLQCRVSLPNVRIA